MCFLCKLLRRGPPTKRGPAPMAQHADLQHFVPGPGPAPGSHSTQYRVNRQLGAPAPEIAPLMFNTGNGAQPWPGVDPAQWRYLGSNSGGVGAAMNEVATVQTWEIQQWDHAIIAPGRDVNLTMNPTRGGEMVRNIMQNLVAPLREQNIPGYVVSQSNVTTSQINTNMATLHAGLRAPGINETASTMCS